MSGQSSQNDKYRWVILGTMFGVQTIASMSTYAFGPLAPFLIDTFSINRAQVGIFSSMNFVAMVFLSAPAGWLVDRFGVRLLLLAGPAMYGVLSIAWSRAPIISIAYVGVLLAGAGYVFTAPTTAMALVEWFPPHSRATAISIKQSGLTLGSAISAVLVPILSLAIGWRDTVAILGALIIVMAAAGSAIYRKPAGQLPRASPPRLSSFRKSMSNRNLLILGFACAIYMVLQVSSGTYLVLQLVEVRQMPVVAAGTFLMLTNLAGVGGRIGWGAASDRLFHGERRFVLTGLGVASGTLAVVISISAASAPLGLLYLSVGLLGATAFSWNGVFLTLATEISSKESVGTGFGWALGLTSIGALVGPPVFGHIVDLTGSYHLSWLIFGLITIAAAFSILLIRVPPRDILTGEESAQSR